MSEQPFHDSVVAADRWSKVAALCVAIAVFLAVRGPVDDVQFASVIAAEAAIGVRLYIPYHASLRLPESERTPLGEHPTAGDYHHGAAGIGLVAAAAVALGTILLGHGFLTSIVVGGISGVVCYLIVARALPFA